MKELGSTIDFSCKLWASIMSRPLRTDLCSYWLHKSRFDPFPLKWPAEYGVEIADLERLIKK